MAYNKKYYDKNKAYYTEYNKKYRDKNKAHLTAYGKKYYETNREAINEYNRLYRVNYNNPPHSHSIYSNESSESVIKINKTPITIRFD